MHCFNTEIQEELLYQCSLYMHLVPSILFFVDACTDTFLDSKCIHWTKNKQCDNIVLITYVVMYNMY